MLAELNGFLYRGGQSNIDLGRPWYLDWISPAWIQWGGEGRREILPKIKWGNSYVNTDQTKHRWFMELILHQSLPDVRFKFADCCHNLNNKIFSVQNDWNIFWCQNIDKTQHWAAHYNFNPWNIFVEEQILLHLV